MSRPHYAVTAPAAGVEAVDGSETPSVEPAGVRSGRPTARRGAGPRGGSRGRGGIEGIHQLPGHAEAALAHHPFGERLRHQRGEHAAARFAARFGRAFFA